MSTKKFLFFFLSVILCLSILLIPNLKNNYSYLNKFIDIVKTKFNLTNEQIIFAFNGEFKNLTDEQI